MLFIDVKMEITVLSNQKPKEKPEEKPDRERLYCPIRKKWVARLPEEIVRLKLVQHMVEKLGFPLVSLVLEKELNQMPHLALYQGKIPGRRADLLCFAKGINRDYDLYPLLLVECKAVKLTPKVIIQVVGYNQYLGAHFIAIANQEEIQIGWMDHEVKKYRFINYMPSYDELIQAVKGVR